MIPPLYISATKQDTGKTTFMIGLAKGVRDLGLDVGYMKPVGQRYVQYQGSNLDEDAVVAICTFHLKDRPIDTSPIAVERGFTEKYIFNRNPAPLEQRVLDAFGRLRQAHSFMIIEGTGHAGVGSCFDLSNAHVAELLGAGVIIVTDGGIGRAIDEVALSLCLFAEHRVKVLGVVLNKVWPEKLEKIRRTVAEGLAHLGTRLLGALPYRPELTLPRIDQVVAELKCQYLCGSQAPYNLIRRTVVAAMEPRNMCRYILDGTLIITPGDRVTDVFCSIVTEPEKHGISGHVAGLVLTCGIVPPDPVLAALSKANVPALLCKEDTYTVATHLRELVFKIRPEDADKIEAARNLVRDHVDIRGIVEDLQESDTATP